MLLTQGLAVLSLAWTTTAAVATHSRLHHRQTKEYEYIVVGSGPGGGPLASRLARAGFKTLLIEAGDDQGDAEYEHVPALSLQASEYEPMSWNYYVSHYADQARQERDSKMVWNATDGTLYTGQDPPEGAEPLGVLYPRSGTLGGCSAHNALITVYPHQSDWTYVANITGDDTWAPDLMRKYFEKLERNQYVPASTLGHGHDGWLNTSLTSLNLVIVDQKLLSVIISAATALGKNIVTALVSTVTGLGHILTDDLNSGSSLRDQTQDVYQVPIAVDLETSRRVGPRNFILDTVSQGYPLDVQLQTLVTKIRFDRSGSTPKAVGVEYIQGESLYAADPRYAAASGTSGYVSASKEVIISAGTFNTPQLLKLSGVGPAAELESFGIDVVVDLPGVGTNMQDRYENTVIAKSPTDFFVSKDCTFLYTEPDPCFEAWQSGTDVVSRGVYASNGISVAVTQKSSVASESDDPDIFITGAPVKFPGYYPNYSRDGLEERSYWSWITLKAHSHNNAGTVTLRSTNPQEVPQITFNSFDTGNTADGGDDKDVQAVYEGMQFARRSFEDLVPLAGGFTEVWPNITDEAELKQFIKDEAWGHHACCTNPIGADDDSMAVLDSSFRVRGVEGLRVVDASVFPKIPGYFIALPVYMISEKAADVIINGS